MSGDEEEGVKIRELIEYSGFRTRAAVSVFLENIGRKIEEAESIVSDVSTGFSILFQTGRRVIGALTSPSIDDVIEHHRRELARLEEKKKKNL